MMNSANVMKSRLFIKPVILMICIFLICVGNFNCESQFAILRFNRFFFGSKNIPNAQFFFVFSKGRTQQIYTEKGYGKLYWKKGELFVLNPWICNLLPGLFLNTLEDDWHGWNFFRCDTLIQRKFLSKFRRFWNIS